ncbi:hypothetical protein IQ273_30410 [Nodosilinea sp. LEGE 07298]|nr:hypothetical protein [Nodosilinea sp. LEGE 07298]
MLEHQGGKYGALIRQAKQSKPENQKIRKPENQTFSQVEPDGQVKEKQVNLCIKVPESWRRHWAIQAKIQDITMTDVMVEALTQRFGLPDNQTAR